MLFSQIEFLIFLAAVIAAMLVLRGNTARKRVLLVASYYFYAYWDWRFLGLILLCTAVNFLAAARIERSANRRERRTLLVLALVASLGMLGYFKYCNFFVESLSALLAPLGIHLGTLTIVLPVGISFFTFQTLSYTLDVYRRKIPTCRDPFDFALFVAFFPQLVAGPIVRASEFLPQLETARSMSWQRTFEGGRQFVFGLFKKVFIADRLAQFVDFVFPNAALFDGATVWLAVTAYAIQIYCDFSGYADMAIGVARVLGYDFSRNFNLPYIATSLEDFWRRWHISLSTWLRDYLYIPLGGNRKGSRRTYLNVFLTMLLGGLWHGAAWTFVLWGALHGGALCVNKWLRSRFGKPARAPRLFAAAGWAVTMLVVLTGWVFFRAPDFPSAVVILERMFLLRPGLGWYHPFALFAIALMAVRHLAAAVGVDHLLELKPYSVRAPAVLATMVWLVVLFRPTGFQPFIYFQF